MKNLKLYFMVILISFVCIFCSSGQTPSEKLFKAVKQGKLAKVNFALANGADINARDKNGNTVLMIACKKRSPRVAKFLVYSTKINVNAKNEKGDTALIIAARNGNSAIVRFLLSKKSRARAKTKDEIVNVNVRNNKGKTALRVALEKNFRLIARLLIQSGARK